MNAKAGFHAESMMVSLSDGVQLHLKRFCRDKLKPGRPMILVHGLAEDGRSFYSQKGRGLGWFMAKQGFDVYALDLRGKGKSWPSLKPRSLEGLHHNIVEDLPAVAKSIERKRGPIAPIWVGHGWGSVLICAAHARFPEEMPAQAMVHFGARRRFDVQGWRAWFTHKLLFRGLLPLACGISGVLPAKALKLGSSDESSQSFKDSLYWSDSASWSDPCDQFDYGQAVAAVQWPPSLYFCCEKDRLSAPATECRRFIADLGAHDGRLIVLSESSGNTQDYGFVEMLTHKDAEQDHFQDAYSWLLEHDAEPDLA